jgi:hypothetical protein
VGDRGAYQQRGGEAESGSPSLRHTTRHSKARHGRKEEEERGITIGKVSYTAGNLKANSRLIAAVAPFFRLPSQSPREAGFSVVKVSIPPGASVTQSANCAA